MIKNGKITTSMEQVSSAVNTLSQSAMMMQSSMAQMSQMSMLYQPQNVANMLGMMPPNNFRIKSFAVDCTGSDLHWDEEQEKSKRLIFKVGNSFSNLENDAQYTRRKKQH